jgi:hypothetical protein
MLKEYPTQQHRGEQNRRWFSNPYFDLIVWQNSLSEITKFQLCYDKSGKERAVTWTQGKGFDHNLIDEGEETPFKNQSPILLKDGQFHASEVLEIFIADSELIDQQIRSFVIDKLSSY